MSSVEADFDRLALMDDEGWTANNPYHDSLLNHVPRYCENALEIGCGTGAFARQLAKVSKRVVALDLSPEYQVADAMTWDFPQAHFDFICSIATLHHTEQRQLLAKLKAALYQSTS